MRSLALAPITGIVTTEAHLPPAARIGPHPEREDLSANVNRELGLEELLARVLLLARALAARPLGDHLCQSTCVGPAHALRAPSTLVMDQTQ